MRGHPRLPAAAVARRVHPPAAADGGRDAHAPLRPGAAGHLAAGVRLPAALRMDAAGRPRPRPRPARCGPGIEEMLAAHSLEYFVADSHLVAAGEPVFLYRDFLPLRERVRDVTPPAAAGEREARSPYAPYRVASRGGTGSAVAFFRDPRTTLQVWSREHGYPGELRVPRVPQEALPGRAALLAHHRHCQATSAASRSTTPKIAAEKVGLQASHFVELVQETAGAGRARAARRLVCSPYDSELFGHWWFEGPLWLEQSAREMASERRARDDARRGASTAVPPQGPLQLPEGSWGEGGDHRVWLNRETEWTWDRVYSAEQEWVEQLRQGDGGHPELKRVLGPGLARAAAAAGLRLAVPHHDRRGAATTPSGGWPSTTRSSSACARWRTRVRGGHAAVDRGGRDAAPARARGLHLPRPRPAWAQAPPQAPDGASSRARPRDDHGRRQGRAPASAHPRALQAGRALRGPLPHHRLRPVELRQLRDAGALRARAVQVAVADRAPAPGLADLAGSCPTTSSPSCRRRCASARPGIAAPPMPCCRTSTWWTTSTPTSWRSSAPTTSTGWTSTRC